MKSISLLRRFTLAITCLVAVQCLQAQTPYALIPGIQIDSLMRTHANPNRMALDPVGGHLFYCLPGGDIYEVTFETGLSPTDSLRYTIADHGIAQPQGMCFVGDHLFVSGNTNANPGYVTARISKGTRQGNGSRIWTTVVETAPHPASKHPFTSVIADPDGDFLYWASGARTMTGEIFNDNNFHPGRREGPFNTRLLRFPITTQNLFLPNDSAALDSSGYTYCSGLRNAYAMAFNGDDHLIAIDNSGERDDPEELNWLQQGRHYGFPWRMGDHWNRLLDPNYDVNQDPLVNPLCGGYLEGIFAADSTFPAVPQGLSFTDPIKNLGPDADFFRDSLTGQVRDASGEGINIRSFTPHRSPLGLTIDRDSLLGDYFRGQAFVLSFMPGGDSSGMSPVSPWGTPGPFVDPAQDLLRLDLAYDTGLGDYVMHAHRIIDGFYLPVDAVLDSNRLYILEQRGGGRHNLWRVTFPLATAANDPVVPTSYAITASPNPTGGAVTLTLEAPRADHLALTVYDFSGRTVLDQGQWAVWPGANARSLDMAELPSGMYLVRVAGRSGNGWIKVVRD